MYPRLPNHSPALGPGVVGPISAIPELLPKSAESASQTERVFYPINGKAPFSLEPQSNFTEGGKQLTQSPIVTGSSIIAVKYKDGVILAADTIGSYGRTLRFKEVQRLHKVNDACVIGAGGEMSDFAYIRELIEDFTMDDFCADDGIVISPKEVHSILCRVLYNRRTKMNPLWNSVVIGGVQDGKPFLGSVGMIGTHYVDDHICTGFGSQLCRPLFREHYRPDLSKEDAIKLVEMCLRVACYRDSSTANKYQIAVCAEEGVTISEPYALELNWGHQVFANPTIHAPGSWNSKHEISSYNSRS